MIIKLDLTSFTYSGAIGAEHYYGSFKWNDANNKLQIFELKHALTQKEAILLNKKDKYARKYQPGEMSERFWTEKEVISCAKKEFAKMFDVEKDSLILGSYASYSAQPVLAAPSRHFETAMRMTELAKEWEKTTRDELTEKIDDEWYNLFKILEK